MAAAWYRARGQLRRRWRTTLLLVLLVGVAGGAVLTTVAGARRSSTAYDRFREETLASDLDIAFDGPPGGDLERAAEQVRALPEVEVVARSEFPFIVPAGSGAYPYLDFLAVVDADGTYDDEVDRPRVLEGTLPDFRRADEIAITEAFARESGLKVGDEADFESYAPDQLEPLFTGGGAGPPAGPRVTLVVRAIVAAPTFLSDSSGDFQPRAFLTPAFREAHGDDVATYPGGLTVKLRRGAADTRAVSRHLREMFPDTMLELTPASELDAKIQSSIDVIVAALLLCALVAAVAGAVAVSQALSRHFAMQGADDRWLAALGMTRSARVASQVAGAVPVALAGGLVAVALSVGASPLMPLGVARRAEPDPGLSVDGPALLVGFAGVVAAALLLAVLAAAVVGRHTRVGAARAAGARPSRAMGALRHMGLPPSATTGVGMAVEPQRGTSWAVRSALLGVVLGVAGLVGVIVFVASAHRLVGSPARYGSPFDAAVSGFSGDVLAEGGDEMLADRDVLQAGAGLSGLARIGDDEVNTYVLESLKGAMAASLLSGHAPTGGREVVLGRSTLEHAGVDIGDEVVVEGAREALRATVVGTAAFPVVDERSSPDRGVLLGRDDFEAISAPDEVNVDILIKWAPGVDVEAANAALAEATGTEVYAPRLPSAVNNLAEVEALPRALATFLALLAAVAVVHALVSTVRLRRQDLAVLRTLGFERRQLGSTLVWQATTIGVIGLAVGVPLGLMAGRVVWRSVAGGIGVVDDPVSPTWAVAVVVVAALTILNVAAALPSRSARNVSAAAALRTP